jgi:two-component system NarL family response regulator
MSPVRVLLADDHPVMRLGVATLVGAQDDMTVVAEATSGREAVALFEKHRPDVTVMDLRMPDIGGHEATALIRSIDPRARILMLTTYDRDEDVHRALQAGALGFVLKEAGSEELLAAIRAVRDGRRWVPPDVARRLDERPVAGELSHRELQILEALRRGLGNRDIAALLDISENTVKFHLKSLFAKLGVSHRTEAVVVAIERGLLTVE